MSDIVMSKSDILQHELAKDFRKGLLKLFIMKMLARESMHGYAIMNRIEELSGWKPSPGSLYPALSNLHINKFITVKVVNMRKVFSITPKGREYIKHLDATFDKGIDDIKSIYNDL